MASTPCATAIPTTPPGPLPTSASSRLAPHAAGTARVAHACSLFLRKRVTLRRLFLAEARHRGRLSADDVARVIVGLDAGCAPADARATADALVAIVGEARDSDSEEGPEEEARSGAGGVTLFELVCAARALLERARARAALRAAARKCGVLIFLYLPVLAVTGPRATQSPPRISSSAAPAASRRCRRAAA